MLQGLDEQGVAYTGYLHTVAEIPLLDFVEPLSRVTPAMKHTRKTGTMVAGGLAVGAVAALAVHLQARGALDDVDYGKVDATATRANVAGVSAILLGAGAVGVAAVSWTVRW